MNKVENYYCEEGCGKRISCEQCKKETEEKKLGEIMVIPIVPKPIGDMIRAKHSGCMIVTEEKMA